MAKKKEVIKEVTQPEYTDILEKYFLEDGIEKVERTYMNGKKVIKTEVSIH